MFYRLKSFVAFFKIIIIIVIIIVVISIIILMINGLNLRARAILFLKNLLVLIYTKLH